MTDTEREIERLRKKADALWAEGKELGSHRLKRQASRLHDRARKLAEAAGEDAGLEKAPVHNKATETNMDRLMRLLRRGD